MLTDSPSTMPNDGGLNDICHGQVDISDVVRAGDRSVDRSSSSADPRSLSTPKTTTSRKRHSETSSGPSSQRGARRHPLTPSNNNNFNQQNNVSSSVVDCGTPQQQSSQSTITLRTIRSLGSTDFGDVSIELNYDSNMKVKEVMQSISDSDEIPFQVVWERRHRLLSSSSNTAYLNDYVHRDRTLVSMIGNGENPELYLWILNGRDRLSWTIYGNLEGVREENGLPTGRWREKVTQGGLWSEQAMQRGRNPKNIRGRGDSSRVSVTDAMSFVCGN